MAHGRLACAALLDRWIDPGNKKPPTAPYACTVRQESQLDRTLWTIALTVAVVLVVLSFARQPLLGGDNEASGFSAPLTLWLPASQAGGQAEAVAQQAAACWDGSGRPATVGVLPGSSSAAVSDFLSRTHGASADLLLLTSTTLSEIAHDNLGTPSSEAGESAQRAVRLLARTSPIAVLGVDALALAVRASSPVHDTAQLLALMRRDPSRPLLGVADDTWSQGNLAALAQSADLHGQVTYSAFNSAREAVVSLDAGEVEVVVAPHSALRAGLRSGSLRELPWPGGQGATPPHAWIAVVAPTGLSTTELATLRGQARRLCAGASWTRTLHGDGLSPTSPSQTQLNGFVREGIGEASRLQSLAAHIVHSY